MATKITTPLKLIRVEHTLFCFTYYYFIYLKAAEFNFVTAEFACFADCTVATAVLSLVRFANGVRTDPINNSNDYCLKFVFKKGTMTATIYTLFRRCKRVLRRCRFACGSEKKIGGSCDRSKVRQDLHRSLSRHPLPQFHRPQQQP